MEMHGWGRFPRINSEVTQPRSISECADIIATLGELIPRGLGRSYGDSSLASRMLDTQHLDHFLNFDQIHGLLTCSAGVSLDSILRLFVPRGWFLPVTPGTRFITIGGAIASDVHGKNHHIDGSFSKHVSSIELLLGNGNIATASAAENTDLFRATCGGMGLTGLIISATLALKPIRSSEIIETTIKMPDLDSVLTAFEENASATYSVAWIDCRERGKHLGRSILMLGEHAETGPLTAERKSAWPVPFEMPAGLLNSSTVKAFNTLYYAKTAPGKHTHRTPFEPFFYPLDKLANWNRLYGKPGFVQYQFVLPKKTCISGLRKILETIATSGRGSPLAVLKVLGQGNQNLLSFPIEGYTLALDFKAEPAVFILLDELDKLVLAHGGRLYLTKDARMSEATFKTSYPLWPEFESIRERHHAIGKFSSIQSKRLGLQ